jgi:ADP-ribosylglycohydrolase
MSIYNIKALKEIQSWNLQELGTDVWLQNQVRVVFADQHLQFFYDEDNDRAPGLTCLDALQKYSQVFPPVTGYEGASNWSKGCGTVMRAPWLGLTGWNRDTVAHLAVLQAQTTHGDPVGWVASAVVALLMKDLFEYRIILTGDDELFNHCVKLTEEITHLFDETVLLGRAADFSAGLRTLTRRWELFASSDENVDMNLFFGEGWFSDEAFYNAVST